MKILREDQILDQKFRKKVIEEINGPENLARKKKQKKIYDLLKDKNKYWVIEELKKEGLKDSTITMMENRASNISVLRKIVEKLARSYYGGVSRETPNEEAEIQVSDLTRLLSFDQKMKKVDRWLEAFKNCCTQFLPVLNERESQDSEEIYDIGVRVFSPYQYDVLNSARNPEQARVHILSDYDPEGYTAVHPWRDNPRDSNIPNNSKENKKDNIIADDDDDRKMSYIWWSDTYHFTTDNEGNILREKSPEDLLNPIQISPFVDFNEDQDGRFWAEGGDDLVDSNILINKQITDMNSIAYQQGWGFPVVTGGESLPDKIEIGTQNAFIAKYNQDEEPAPTVEIVQGNPPLDAWGNMIAQYLSLILTTNGLSPGQISTQNQPFQLASGISKMLDEAEATTDVTDKQKMFKAKERESFMVIFAWQNILEEQNVLSTDFAEVGAISEGLHKEITTKFHEARKPVNEKDKLEELEKRKELGLDTEVDLMIRDNPDMTPEEAEEKLKKIKEEKLKRIEEMRKQLRADQESKPPVQPMGSNGNQAAKEPGPSGPNP